MFFKYFLPLFECFSILKNTIFRALFINSFFEKIDNLSFSDIILQVLVLGNAFTLEQRLQLSEVHGNVSLHNLLVHNKGESLMLNLVLPLCLKIGCGNKDDPNLRKIDIQFTLNLLLNMINPGGKTRSITNGVSSSGSNIGSSLNMPNPAGSNR